MAAQALYLKYRPQTFDEVVGQAPITKTLRNALRQGKIRHAYLFTGPRGTGKTTTARLLAKAVNCLASEGEKPCNVCSICVAINEGRLLDLIEIDAASNRGIDEIRDIREKVGFRPNEGRFKIYVLDEAHMLTEPAFNALLKTLEEPPPHVIFALVTTDPHKIPATITSRCQRFDFRRIPLQSIIDRLGYIAGQEEITVEPEALELIARQGTGAMRDAISLLDQLTSYGDKVTLDQVQMVLGTVAGEAAAQLAADLADGNVAGGLDRINRTVGDGADPRQFGREVVEYLRDVLLINQGMGTRLLNATAEQAAEMEALAQRMSVEQLLRAIRLFNDAVTDVKSGLQMIPQLPLELALVQSITGAGETEAASQTDKEREQATVRIPDATPTVPKVEGHRVAESPASEPAPAPVPAEPVTSTPNAEPVAQGSSDSGQLTLEVVQRSWDRVLVAVRQRNPTAEGALRSGCVPVEVTGNQVVVTFPYPFLRDKLGDPQRKVEIQDALSEVVGGSCHVKLVLASEYVPGHAPSLAAPASDAASPQATMGAEDLDQITRWAEKLGGETKVVDEP
jgi:DNA polymerase-3 subunit gamma/tau